MAIVLGLSPLLSSARPLVMEASATESPYRLREAGPDLLSLALMDARNHTLRLFALYAEALGAGGFAVPRSNELNPPLWELGHVGWFQEYWLGRHVQRDRGRRADPSVPRLASILPQADALYDSSHVPHDTRWDLALPDADETRQYLLETLDGTLELLARATDGDDSLYFYRLALFHEDMHGEAFAYAAQTLGLGGKAMEALFGEPVVLAPREPIAFPAMRFEQGSSDVRGFSFDNERLAHGVVLPEFEIDAQPVTWQQYAEFVEDGGYDEPAWWSSDGQAWLAAAQAEGRPRRAPRHVEQMRGGVLAHRFGRLLRVPLAAPVVHVTAYEAEAWCRWAGRRLPTEVEWEAAAVTGGAARGFRWGEVWEWTASSFRPYPGFEPDPYRDYSAPWFGSHRALRGASFATRARMRHARYRNFYAPDRDDLFAGFRSCSL